MGAAACALRTRLVQRLKRSTLRRRLWNSELGQLIAELKPKGPATLKFPQGSFDLKALIEALSGRAVATFDATGQRLITSSDDASARIWDSETGSELIALHGHEKGILSAAFSPNSTEVVTVSKDGSARLWSAASGSPLAMLKGQGESLQDAIFAPDGGRLLTIGTEGWIRIWKPSEIGALKGGDLRNWMCADKSTKIYIRHLSFFERGADKQHGAKRTPARGLSMARNSELGRLTGGHAAMRQGVQRQATV